MSILEFRLRKIGETRNYILDKIKYNDLMNEKNIIRHLSIQLMLNVCLF